MYKHEDDRRLLMEISGDFKTCKSIVAKDECVLGDHYHMGKDEQFVLASGWALEVVVGDARWISVPAPHSWYVPRGTYHRFVLEKGSVLVGTASEEYDAADEVHGWPQ